LRLNTNRHILRKCSTIKILRALSSRKPDLLEVSLEGNNDIKVTFHENNTIGNYLSLDYPKNLILNKGNLQFDQVAEISLYLGFMFWNEPVLKHSDNLKDIEPDMYYWSNVQEDMPDVGSIGNLAEEYEEDWGDAVDGLSGDDLISHVNEITRSADEEYDGEASRMPSFEKSIYKIIRDKVSPQFEDKGEILYRDCLSQYTGFITKHKKNSESEAPISKISLNEFTATVFKYELFSALINAGFHPLYTYPRFKCFQHTYLARIVPSFVISKNYRYSNSIDFRAGKMKISPLLYLKIVKSQDALCNEEDYRSVLCELILLHLDVVTENDLTKSAFSKQVDFDSKLVNPSPTPAKFKAKYVPVMAKKTIDMRYSNFTYVTSALEEAVTKRQYLVEDKIYFVGRIIDGACLGDLFFLKGEVRSFMVQRDVSYIIPPEHDEYIRVQTENYQGYVVLKFDEIALSIEGDTKTISGQMDLEL